MTVEDSAHVVVTADVARVTSTVHCLPASTGHRPAAAWVTVNDHPHRLVLHFLATPTGRRHLGGHEICDVTQTSVTSRLSQVRRK